LTKCYQELCRENYVPQLDSANRIW